MIALIALEGADVPMVTRAAETKVSQLPVPVLSSQFPVAHYQSELVKLTKRLLATGN